MSRKKGYKHSKKTIKKLSVSKLGNKNPNYGKHASIATKKKMSEAHKIIGAPWMNGKHHSIKRRKKMSESMKGSKNHWFGKHHSKETKKKWSLMRRGKQLGDQHPGWKGIKVSYIGIHKWVVKHLGHPIQCEYCGEIGKFCVRKDGKKVWNIDWANKYHTYLRNLNDWIALCRKCHKKYDVQFIDLDTKRGS